MKPSAYASEAAVLVALLALLTLPGRATDSITNFGLLHTSLGQATLSSDGNTFVHVTTNSGDGVSIFVGESDSGVLISPNVSWVEVRDFLHADVYGQLNGMTNQRLASARGRYRGWDSDEEGVEYEDEGWVWQPGWGEYVAGVDLSPLGGSSLTVIAFAGERVVGVVSNASRTFGVANGQWGWGNPLRRAAPFWRMPDGSVGALFDFWWPTAFGPFGAIGNRYFVRCENPTNTAGFVSQVNVISRDLPSPYVEPPTNFGTGIIGFEVGDVRVGMFHRGHRAFDQSLLRATNGRLSVILLTNDPPDMQPLLGVAVDLGQATSFQAEFLPIDLNAEDAAFLVTGIGDALGFTGSDCGTMRIDNTNGNCRISAEFAIAPRFAQIVVLSGGVAVGTNGVPRDMVWITASPSRRIIAAGLLARTLSSLPGFTVRLDGTTSFTTSTGERFEGDEVRLLASDPANFVNLETCIFRGCNLSSLTITGERSEAFVLPLLSIACSGTNVVLSWPDPNEVFEVERASLVDNPDEETAAWFFQPETNGVTSLNGFRSLRWPIRFSRQECFRLRHGPPRPPRPVD
jgi:hypothetical protein